MTRLVVRLACLCPYIAVALLASFKCHAQTLINYGDTVTDSIATTGEIDVYFFSGTVGEVITARMVSDYAFGPQFEIYDPDGTRLGRATGWNSYSARLDTLRLKKTGLYTLLAMDDDGLNTFHYGLYLQRLMDPGGGQTITYGETVADSITTQATMKAYNFSGAAGGVITVRMTSDIAGGPQFEIYDPDRMRLVRVTAWATSIRLDTLRLKKSGTYTLLAMDDDGVNIVHYGLYLQRLMDPGGGQTITYGETVADFITTQATMKAYNFSGTVGEVITARMVSDYAFGPQFEIYDPDGTRLGRATGWNSYSARLDTLRLKKTGLYTLLAMDDDGLNTFHYGLYLQRLMDPGGGQTITYGETVADSITTQATMKAYNFSGAAGGVITVRMTSDIAGGPQFEIYDPDRMRLVRVTAWATSIRLDTLRLKKSGTYTLLAMDDDGVNIVHYGLYLQRLMDPGGGQTITYGETVADFITTQATMKAYNFSGTVGEVITARMVSDYAFGPQFEIYDPDGTRLGRATGWNSYSARLDTLRLKKTGLYTLLAMDDDGLNTFHYGLYLQRLMDPGGGQTITYGETVADSITTQATMKAYNFSGAAGGVITVRMTSDIAGGPQFEIYDPDRMRLVRVTAWATSIRLDTLRLKKSGTYTLLAMDDDGVNKIHYTLSLIGLTRVWAGAIDSSWHNPSNWFPSGIPNPTDSVVIAAGLRDPVIYVPQSEVLIGRLNLTSAGHLTVSETVPRLVISDLAAINGRLDISASDTLFIQQPAPSALQGSGKIPRGTIQRFVPQTAAGRYRFESDSTYIRYDGAITVPTIVSMTAYPDSSPSDLGFVWTSVASTSIVGTQTLQAKNVAIGSNRRWAIKIPRNTRRTTTQLASDDFIRRSFASTVVGDTAAKVTLSLHYELTELPAGSPAESLQICWSAGVLTHAKNESTLLPAQYALYQNYPNPFNPTTEIRFDLPSESFVSLRIYNLLGQLMKTLVNEPRSGGTYTVRWDGTDEAGYQTAGGVYFSRLTTFPNGHDGGTFTQVRKMLYVK